MTRTAAPVVFVVDDDASVRDSLRNLFRSVGLQVELFDSVEACLERSVVIEPACLILDVRLPGISGLEFQRRLRGSGNRTPIIFLTGHGDVPMSVQAMKDGALEFLMKPFRDQDLLDVVQLALEESRGYKEELQSREVLIKSYATLTLREREIMKLVAQGLMNKQIATLVGLSEVTVKVHRGAVMRKMNANTLADLVRMADRLKDWEDGGIRKV